MKKEVTLSSLLQFAKNKSTELLRNYGQNSTDKEIVLARTVKLSEEVGELCNEVLASQGDQRREKLNSYTKEGLEDEFADVILTALVLAEFMKVDIKKALRNKLRKIKKLKK